MRIDAINSYNNNFRSFHVQKGASIDKSTWLKSPLVKNLAKDFEVVANSKVVEDRTKKIYTENDVIKSATKSAFKLMGTVFSILGVGYFILPASIYSLWGTMALASVAALRVFVNEYKGRPIQGQYPKKTIEYINFGNSIYKDPDGYIELIGKNEFPMTNGRCMQLSGYWTLEQIKMLEEKKQKKMSVNKFMDSKFIKYVKGLIGKKV